MYLSIHLSLLLSFSLVFVSISAYQVIQEVADSVADSEWQVTGLKGLLRVFEKVQLIQYMVPKSMGLFEYYFSAFSSSSSFVSSCAGCAGLRGGLFTGE